MLTTKLWCESGAKNFISIYVYLDIYSLFIISRLKSIFKWKPMQWQREANQTKLLLLRTKKKKTQWWISSATVSSLTTPPPIFLLQGEPEPRAFAIATHTYIIIEAFSYDMTDYMDTERWTSIPASERDMQRPFCHEPQIKSTQHTHIHAPI